MSPAAAIAFVRVDSRQSPNLRQHGTDPLSSYYKAMIVAFASVRRWHPHWTLQLVTTEPPPQPYAEQLSGLGVDLCLQPFRHQPPAGFATQFAGSLYMLDAARACETQDTVFIDPDVVCISDMRRMLASVGTDVGALPLKYPPEAPIAGLSLDDARHLHSLLGEPTSEAPTHYGGECYVIPAGHAAKLNERAEFAWQLSLERYSSNATRFTTEEHILSYALRGVPTSSLGAHVRRIWTAATYRTIHGDEPTMTLWHLPAEKSTGFRRLYRTALDTGSWFWSADPREFTAKVGRIMGVTSRTPARWLRDQTVGAVSRVKAATTG